MQELDAKYQAGWRPSKGYCMFGGETPMLDAYCARVNFGQEGVEMVVREINGEILLARRGKNVVCTEHVAIARARLQGYGFKTTELYSCDDNPPMRNGRPVCHVSLMVTDATTGASFVMDNGHVLSPATQQGVGTYTQFASLVDRVWTGSNQYAVALGQ